MRPQKIKFLYSKNDCYLQEKVQEQRLPKQKQWLVSKSQNSTQKPFWQNFNSALHLHLWCLVLTFWNINPSYADTDIYVHFAAVLTWDNYFTKKSHREIVVSVCHEKYLTCLVVNATAYHRQLTRLTVMRTPGGEWSRCVPCWRVSTTLRQDEQTPGVYGCTVTSVNDQV